MQRAARLLALLCLAAATSLAQAQFAPPRQDGDAREAHRLRRDLRESAPEQREERRERREQWMQMSPEERHQLRRDIRDAGRDVYRHPRHRGRD